MALLGLAESPSKVYSAGHEHVRWGVTRGLIAGLVTVPPKKLVGVLRGTT